VRSSLTGAALTGDDEDVLVFSFVAAGRRDAADVRVWVGALVDAADRQPVLAIDRVVAGVRVLGIDVEVAVVVAAAAEDDERVVRRRPGHRAPLDALRRRRRRPGAGVEAVDRHAAHLRDGQMRNLAGARARRQHH